ncbi:MAG: imidazole glycerol phosphate synthase subunit HisH [Nitrososphaeria archaeon]|nr:imidazole glycerol phosphate synthase subunit HisH [Nitrososphaeria archaeon]
MLAIIEYGMGNVRSVYNAFTLLEQDVQITSDPKQLKDADAIVLPGVGAFSDGMRNLREKGLLNELTEQVIDNKKPYLGICLGLEFLAEKSYEGGITDGFGWIKGTINRIEPSDLQLKVPHIGWDDTKILKSDGLLKEMTLPAFYYLHSYYFKIPESQKNVITSVCNYGDVEIVSSIQKDNIHAVQFHPEKSQEAGLKLLKNFLDEIKK